MPAPEDHWLDEEAGPVVRPYALTRGRTRPAGEVLDLIALVTAVRGVEVGRVGLDPEHLALLSMCRLPASVADLAAGRGPGPPRRPAVAQAHRGSSSDPACTVARHADTQGGG